MKMKFRRCGLISAFADSGSAVVVPAGLVMLPPDSLEAYDTAYDRIG
jgi:hypothetical protein